MDVRTQKPAAPKETSGESFSQRAQNKDNRRTRLIHAARDLIGENANGNFSMQELADRAGLSLATPYNLLGSKLAILQEVFRAESEGFKRDSVALYPGEPVKSVLATAESLVSVFARKSNFYRGLARSLLALSSDDFKGNILPISDAFFRPLVDGLAREGVLIPTIPPSIVSAHLMRVFTSTFFLWAASEWDEPRFAQEMKIGFALCFAGLFKGNNRDNLLAALQDFPSP